jgi:hypothetical protein
MQRSQWLCKQEQIKGMLDCEDRSVNRHIRQECILAGGTLMNAFWQEAPSAARYGSCDAVAIPILPEIKLYEYSPT